MLEKLQIHAKNPIKIMKKLKTSLLLLAINYASAAHSQEIPPEPPKKIAIAEKDKYSFICDVKEVNNHSYMGTRNTKNMWDEFMHGGKFQAIKSDRIRVTSSSDSDARNEVYDFYKRYAAAAFVKFSYDKGTLPIERIVKSCTPEEGRSAQLDIKDYPNSKYIELSEDKSFIMTFISLFKTSKPNLEIIKAAYSSIDIPTDAFAQKEFIDGRIAALKSESQPFANGLYMLNSEIHLNPYDFDKGVFHYKSLDNDLHSYSYSYKTGSNSRERFNLPALDLITPTYERYRPASIDEAKRIESARSKNGRLKTKIYIQATGSTIEKNRSTIKGLISHFEVYDNENKLLFKQVMKR